MLKTVYDIQIQKITNIQKNLKEIKRKSDYRFSNEPLSLDEKVAWITAVKLFVGHLGIK
ncbi:hypothetical protein ACAG39_06815 [Caldicellulosiruptoraceae bacterium PP1]